MSFLRLGVGFSSLPTNLGCSIMGVTPRESSSYGRMRESLVLLLKRLPTHEEIVEWLEKISRAHRCGFHCLFRRDDIFLMAKNEDPTVRLDADVVEPPPLSTADAVDPSRELVDLRAWMNDDVLCEAPYVTP